MKLLAKFLACTEYSALNRAKGQIQLFGDFVVFVTGHEHVERNPVFVGKRIECYIDLFHRK